MRKDGVTLFANRMLRYLCRLELVFYLHFAATSAYLNLRWIITLSHTHSFGPLHFICVWESALIGLISHWNRNPKNETNRKELIAIHGIRVANCWTRSAYNHPPIHTHAPSCTPTQTRARRARFVVRFYGKIYYVALNKIRKLFTLTFAIHTHSSANSKRLKWD